MLHRSFNWRPYPFIRILLGLLLGIILETHYPITINHWLLSSIFFFCLLFLWMSIFRKMSIQRNKLIGGFTFGLFIILGIITVKFQNPWITSNYYGKYLNGDNKEILFRVEDIHLKDNWIKLIGEVRTIRNKQDKVIPSNGKLLLYIEPKEITPGYGQLIKLSTKINTIPGPKNPNAFDYKTYQANNDIYFQGFCKGDYWSSTNKYESTFQIIANRIRAKLLILFKSALGNGQEYAVGSALVLGFRDDVSEEINNAYIQTGSIHILAVSGLHVGIISGFLGLLLGMIKYNSLKIRLLKLLIILVFLWGFVLIVGAGGSIIRAAVMFSIIHTGSMLAKRKYTYNTLAASAFVILIWNPKMLYDVGFLLSYAAVIGIITIQPLLKRLWYPESKIIKMIWELSTITLAAQIATIPLVLYFFNQTSIYFLISGIIVVPISTIAMYAGIALFISNLILPILNGFIGSIMYGCLYLMNSIIYEIQKLPGNLIDNISFTALEATILLMAITFLVFSLSYRHKTSFKYTLFSLLLLVAVRTYLILDANNQRLIVFYSSSKAIIVDYYIGRRCVNLYREENPKEERFIARNNRISHRIDKTIKCSLDKQILFNDFSFNQAELKDPKAKVFFLSKKSEEFYGNTTAENVYVIDYDTPDKIVFNKITKRIFLNPAMSIQSVNAWKTWSQGRQFEIIDLRENAYIFNYS